MALYRVPTQNALQFTLDSQIAAGASSLTLSSSGAGLLQTPGVLVIDRVDSSGNLTPTKREYFSFTGNSGTSVTGLVGGLAGSSQQIHAAGAVVEFIPDVIWADAVYTTMVKEHDTSGTHISLPSLRMIYTGDLAGTSSASLNTLFTRGLSVASNASLRDLFVSNSLTASGASLAGVNTTTPVWVFPGTVSGASSQIFPIDMPRAGTIQFASAITKNGSSNASLSIDIQKNGTSIFNATASTNALFFIPVNGTYVSTASIATTTFVAGDVFTYSILFPGSMATDLTIKFSAR